MFVLIGAGIARKLMRSEILSVPEVDHCNGGCGLSDLAVVLVLVLF